MVGTSAYDRWLRRFLYPMGCLKFQILCHSLRILIRVDIDNLEPTHLEDVYAMIPVRGTVDKSVLCRPSHDDRAVIGQSLYPNVMDGKSKSGAQVSETLEPAADGLTIMTLTAQGVRPVKAMMNVGDAVFEQRAEVLLIYSFKVPSSDPLHYGVIHGAAPSEFNVNIGHIGRRESGPRSGASESALSLCSDR
jgi:hypothetical protein